MSSLPLEYTTEAHDKYLRTVQARTIMLSQLNDVRVDERVLAAAGVTREEAGTAFETLWKVASLYESQLWVDANEERKNNQVVADRIKSGLFPGPVPASAAVGE